MSEHTTTGPPIWTYSSGTMDLRDWFAGMCDLPYRSAASIRSMTDDNLVFFVHSLLGDEAAPQFVGSKETLQAETIYRTQLEAKAIAALRYMQADAMMAERERRRGYDVEEPT